MIRNRNLIYSRSNNSSPDADKFFQLPKIATASLPTAVVDGSNGENEGGLVYDLTTNTVKFSDGSSWANISSGGGSSTLAGLTDTDISSPASGELLIYDGTNSWDNIALSGDVTVNSTGVTAIGSGVIVNDDINASAGIVFTKLAALNRGNVLIGNATNQAAAVDASTDAQILIGDGTDLNSVAVTGDVSITNAGVTTVTDLTIASEAQGDILYRNATNWVRLAAGTAGEALVTAGAGSNPYWGAPSIATASVLANSVTAEAGASDYTINFGTAGGAYTLTVPAVGGARTFSFINEAETFSANKIFGNTNLLLRDTDASHSLTLKWNENEAASARTLNFLLNAGSRSIDLTGNLTLAADLTTTTAEVTLAADGAGSSVILPATGTLSTLAGSETLTNKILTSPDVNGGTVDSLTALSVRSTGAAFDLTIACDTVFSANRTLTLTTPDSAVALILPATGTLATLAGTETLTNKTLSNNVATGFVYAAGGNAISLQNAVHTVVGRDTTDTLTNKTIDADGTGNVIQNINANELDPITIAASAQFGIPFVLPYVLSNQAAAVNIYNANSPIKFQIIKAWSVATSADGGTWKLNNGAGGGGTDITNAVTVAAADQDFDEPTDYDDSAWVINSNGSLSIVPDGAGLLDCQIFIMCLRVD